MAQLVAHLHGMEGVRGSNPLSSTKMQHEPRYMAGFLLSAPGVVAFVAHTATFVDYLRVRDIFALDCDMKMLTRIKGDHNEVRVF